MKTDLFDYDLPASAIAQSPHIPREQAKLLHLTPQNQPSGAPTLTDYRIADLPDLLKPNDVLIVNNTKVLPALLKGTRLRLPEHKNAEPAMIRCNLLEPTNHDYQNFSDEWVALAYPSKKIQPDDRIFIEDNFYWQLIRKLPDGRIILKFNHTGDELLAKLQAYGVMPIPPYLKREAVSADQDDYQTCFASQQGAVAAPTAGLHFTHSLMQQLQQQNIAIAEVTLHVGAGTFLPVKTEHIEQHQIHHEWGELPLATIRAMEKCKQQGGDIIAIGTTSLRVLEWAYQQSDNLLQHSHAITGMIDLFVTPGFEFKLCDRLMTNFHQPRSSLMALVSAFAGLENIQTAYQYALKNHYRFLSYGDACLLDKPS